MLDPVEPAGDERGDREVRVGVAAGHPALDPQRRTVTHEPQRARAVVDTPRDRGRGERARLVALVGVDVGCEAQGELAQGRELAREEVLAGLRQPVAVGEHRRAVAVRIARASRSDRCTWHELPSRSLTFAMNVRLMPSCAAISLAPVL